VTEARTGKRFPLELQATIRRDPGSDASTAITHDVSAAGVYLWAETEMEIGSEVEFDLKLPGSVIGTPTDVHIQCRGRVVRSDRSDPGDSSKSGVACVIDQYKFIRKK
jgi:hypothetical protein